MIESYHPVMQAFLATLFTWGVTALGASTVFLVKTVNRKLLDSMMGFAAGVMIAASYWSLLAPAIQMSENGALPMWVPATIGFLSGGLFLAIMDKILPHLHLGLPIKDAEGTRTTWKRSVLLVLAITLHNFPEGLAVGVAFGAAATNLPASTLPAAIALAIGIGIQNFPEGIAVSLPLHGEGLSRLRSFWYGQLSAAIEPVAAVIGASAVFFFRPLLPYALSFAAGAMIFVVIEELIPESQNNGNTDLATLSALAGFAIMWFWMWLWANKGEPMKQPSFLSIVLKTSVIHTVTYFIVGLVAFTFLDYSAKYADPAIANLMRQTDHPLVAAGPSFQVLRGFLFGIVFYVLRETVFPRKRGWLTLWLMLIFVGILSPFGPTPGSIEGVLYTVLPAWFHIVGLPEVFVQAGLLAFLTHYWINHPEKKWLNWLFGAAFVSVILLSTLGVLSALGIIVQEVPK